MLNSEKNLLEDVYNVFFGENYFLVVDELSKVACQTLHRQVDAFLLDEYILELDDVRMVDGLQDLDFSD
jgi:hypothetical protein